MPAAPFPPDEAARLAELRALDLLDTVQEQAYDDLTRLASEVAGVPISLVSLVDEDRQWFKSSVGLDAPETPRDEAFCAHAILEPGRTLVVEDATKDPRFADNPLVTGGPGIRFYAGTPLVTSRGQALGTLCVIDREPGSLDEAQLAALEALGRQVVALVELRRSVQQLEAAALLQRAQERQLADYRHELETRVRELAELSLRDGLTGLLNRGAVEDRLAEELAAHRRHGRPVAVVMADVDHFKRRNDEHGHAAGDRALRAVAQAMQEALRDEDVAGRFGGEEFVCVLPETDLAGALRAADRMRLAIERLDLPEGRITASFGVALAEPGRHDTATLLRAADRALYDAKASGRNCVCSAMPEGVTVTLDVDVAGWAPAERG